MGCDFIWRGTVEDPTTQERLIRFLPWQGNELVLPRPDVQVPATVEATWAKAGSTSPTRQPAAFSAEHFKAVFDQVERHYELAKDHESYPLNFFGIAPPCNGDREMWGRYQFVFDRSGGGRLVTLVPPDPSRVEPGMRLLVKDGGYQRALGDHAGWLGFVLEVARMRYCPDMDVGDDYGYCRLMRQRIGDWHLSARLSDERLTFEDCEQIFLHAMRVHEPD